MTPRIALGALLFEGNTLSPVVSGIEAFANRYLARGEEIRATLAGTGTEIAGALSVFDAAGVDAIPLIAANGGSGGRVAAGAYAALKADMLDRLRAALPVDGVYLALHGAFIAQGLDDVEGDVLEAVRALVGVETPVVVSLDLHAHVTAAMMRLATALIGYREYPHDDTFETGERAARLLLDALAGRVRPVMRLRRAPMIVPPRRQRTKGQGPMAGIVARAREAERDGAALAASYFCVQPWLDLPDLGFTAVVVADGDAAAADRVARDLVELAWAARREFSVATVDVEDAIRRGLAVAGGPVVLADPSDCVGGGASGDSAVALGPLIEAGAEAAIQIVDPASVAQAWAAGVGARIAVRLGNRLDPAYGEPFAGEAIVERLFDGRFVYVGGLMRGVTASMGDSAVLRMGAVRVLATSASAYEYGDEQFRAAGIDPQSLKFIVVKNPMNYLQAFAAAPAAFDLKTPGPTTPDLARIAWRRMSRPRFPLDDDFVPEFATR